MVARRTSLVASAATIGLLAAAVSTCGGGPRALSAGGGNGTTTGGVPGDGGPPERGGPISIPSVAWSHPVGGDSYVDGAPVGGLGAGSVTWRFDGAFYHDRLDLAPPAPKPSTRTRASSCTRRPAPARRRKRGRRASTRPSAPARPYYALFPRAWVDYAGPAFACKLKVEQMSPIIPGRLPAVELPGEIYRWQIDNPHRVALRRRGHAHLGQRSRRQRRATAQAAGSRSAWSSGGAAGTRPPRGGGRDHAGEPRGPGVTVSYQSGGSVAALQAALAGDGTLADTTGNDALGAIAFKVTVAPGGQAIVPIVLAWDIPITQQGTGPGWFREYTRYHGRSGRSSWAIATEALSNYETWLGAVEDWQDGVIADPRYPPWLVAPLFNELYYYLTSPGRRGRRAPRPASPTIRTRTCSRASSRSSTRSMAPPTCATTDRGPSPSSGRRSTSKS